MYSDNLINDRNVYFSSRECHECVDHPCCGACDTCTPDGCVFMGFFDELVDDHLCFDLSLYFSVCRSFPLYLNRKLFHNYYRGFCDLTNNINLIESLQDFLGANHGVINIETPDFTLIAE